VRRSCVGLGIGDRVWQEPRNRICLAEQCTVALNKKSGSKHCCMQIMLVCASCGLVQCVLWVRDHYMETMGL
jgi:hypothetical protein